MSLYPNLNAEMARFEMSKRDLAKHLGVSPQTITNWLNGSSSIPSRKLIEMSALFGVTTDYLLGLGI